MARDVNDGGGLTSIPREHDSIVAIIGSFRSGKTTFVDIVSQRIPLACHTLANDVSDEIKAVRCPHPKDPSHTVQVVFLDTPGLDDDSEKNSAVFQRISDWRIAAYGEGKPIQAIIYLHPITLKRVTSDTLRHLRMLQAAALQANVVIATTMWPANQLPDVDSPRELALKTAYWKQLIERGAMTARFLRTSDSAWEIVDMALQHPGVKHAVKIQIPEMGLSRSPPEGFSENSTTVPLRAKGLAAPPRVVSSVSSPTALQAVSEDDLVVAVIGAAGSGKSTVSLWHVVNMISQHSLVAVHKRGRWAKAHGNEPKAGIVYKTNSNRDHGVVLVDTPGFDDSISSLSDDEVLEMLADWLTKTYGPHKRVNGLIFLCSIAGGRITGTARKYIPTLAKLCGENAPTKSILCTSRWTLHDSTRELELEQNLRAVYWKPMLDHGAQMSKFDLTHHSAWAIIDAITQTNSALAAGPQMSTRRGLRIRDTLREMSQMLTELQETMLCLQSVPEPANCAALFEELPKLRDSLRCISEDMRKLTVPGSVTSPPCRA